MEKCLDCNSIITKQETVCYNCGTAVHRKGAGGFPAGLVTTINILLTTAAVLTVASLFLDFTPPFSRCAVVTLVLGIVKSSAGQMHEKKKE